MRPAIIARAKRSIAVGHQFALGQTRCISRSSAAGGPVRRAQVLPTFLGVATIRSQKEAFTPKSMSDVTTSRGLSSEASSPQDELASSSCEPCKRSTPALPASEHAQYLSQLQPGWRLEPFPGSEDLAVVQRRFEFKNFKQALAFANRIGMEVAEAHKHHPEILMGWGHVDVAWWSHAIGGVSENIQSLPSCVLAENFDLTR